MISIARSSVTGAAGIVAAAWASPRTRTKNSSTVTARWSPTAGCSPCPNRPSATSSSTSRAPATTPRTTGSSGCSTCSAWSTRPTWTRRGVRRSVPGRPARRAGRRGELLDQAARAPV